MSTLGLRRWEKILFQLSATLLAIGILQVILVSLLSPSGILPPSFVGLSIPAVLVLLLSTIGVTVVILAVRLRYANREPMLKQSDQGFAGMIPVKVTRECVVLSAGQGFSALGFVSLPSEWNEVLGKRVIQTLSRLEMSNVLVLARTLDGNIHTHIMLCRFAKKPEQAIQNVMAACQVLHQALVSQGVAAERVTDELGVEQLYWTCVLGKDFHEDVLLRGEEKLVVAKVGGKEERLLAAVDLLHTTLPQTMQGTRPLGLLSLLGQPRPMFLTVSLQPVASEVVAKQLQAMVMEAPELSLLVEAVGEAAAIQILRDEESPRIAELAALLAGREEGLWQCNVHLICRLTDTPILAETIGLPAILLEPKGLAAIATAQPHQSGLLLPTGTLFQVLGLKARSQAQETETEGLPEGG